MEVVAVVQSCRITDRLSCSPGLQLFVLLSCLPKAVVAASGFWVVGGSEDWLCRVSEVVLGASFTVDKLDEADEQQHSSNQLRSVSLNVH